MKTPRQMCLDMVEVKITKVDNKPMANGAELRFAKNGRVWVHDTEKEGGFRLATKEELEAVFMPMVKRYGMIPAGT